MQTPELLLLIVLVAGLVGGAVGTHLLYRRRVDESVAARTQQLELQQQQSQNEFALKTAELQNQAQQLAEQLHERRERVLQLEQQQDQQRSALGQVQQELAAAREKIQHQSELQQQLRERDAQLLSARTEATELHTRLGQERKNFEQQLQLLQDAKMQLTGEFENLANKIFERKQEQFSTSSKSLLETTIDPLKTQLSEFRRKVEDVYEKENAERNRLAGQVVELQKQAQKIGEDAVNLAQALKGNTKSQGNWGEVVLERLLEQSGLQKGREYETQVTYSGSDGSRRTPDVIVRLPENKDIVIDAKVSLVDYERFCNTEDEHERQEHLRQHVNSLRNHIKGLSVKEYEKLEGVKSLDFVLIFVPIEAAFMLALQHEPNLYSEAYDRHIILASPTTLLAILRTVENIWRYEKQNRNAERIAREAGALHDHFVRFVEALDGVKAHLGRTQEAFDTAYKRLYTGRGNLVKKVHDIRRLGAKTKKTIERELMETATDEHERPLETQPEAYLELDES